MEGSYFQGVYSRGAPLLLGRDDEKMKRNFKFVNVSGGAYHDVTDQCLESDYNINSAAAT
jgi:hypothetical protein